MVWSTQKTTQGKYVLEGVVDGNYAVNVDSKKFLSDFVFILFGINKSWKKIKICYLFIYKSSEVYFSGWGG